MPRRRTWHITLSLLALFLLGTLIVLSTVSFYLRIDKAAYLHEHELSDHSNFTRLIPKILHQTWIHDVLPEKWRGVSQACRDLMPDYEYMLWTDATSRTFIATHYAWFLPTFDAYRYPIQRADAIRYFILHHHGGVYLDLDVGCLKPLDPLLNFPVVLPKTIPVGVSNDLMFAQPKHPFMEQTIHNLVTFDHSWVLNYPTVMFSTGPMFLSAQYGLYAAAHPNEVRILPKSLYGKNAKVGEAPHSFFTHYYGSSWHADDAGFITFLGTWGKTLMWLGLVILVLGSSKLFFLRMRKSSKSSTHHAIAASIRRRLLMGRYDVLLPRVTQRSGRLHLDLGSFSLSNSTAASSAGNTQPPSPTSTSPASTPPSSPILGDGRTMPLLPMFAAAAVHVEPGDSESALPSPVSDSPSGLGLGPRTRLSPSNAAAQALRSAGAWVRTNLSGEQNARPRRPPAATSLNIFSSTFSSGLGGGGTGRNPRRRSTLFFLPAIFTPSLAPSPGAETLPGLSRQQRDRDLKSKDAFGEPSLRLRHEDELGENEIELPILLNEEEDISAASASPSVPTLRPPSSFKPSTSASSSTLPSPSRSLRALPLSRSSSNVSSMRQSSPQPLSLDSSPNRTYSFPQLPAYDYMPRSPRSSSSPPPQPHIRPQMPAQCQTYTPQSAWSNAWGEWDRDGDEDSSRKVVNSS